MGHPGVHLNDTIKLADPENYIREPKKYNPHLAYNRVMTV